MSHHAGTCINNTSVMMFKKGSFEIGTTVYPVAIKVRFFLSSLFQCKELKLGGSDTVVMC